MSGMLSFFFFFLWCKPFVGYYVARYPVEFFECASLSFHVQSEAGGGGAGVVPASRGALLQPGEE